MNRLVSIIMPVYNGEEYISIAIESVLAQTYTNFELIIINDASTDNTANIFEKYSKQDGRIKIVTNNANFKVVKSLNIGLRKSKGEFVARIDADDIWSNDKLEKQLDRFNVDKDLYLLGTSKYLINENGSLINRHEKNIYTYIDIKKNILKHNLFCHSSVMFRKDVVKDIGYYNEKYKNTEDYEYWIRIIYKYKAEILNEPLTYYRITPQMVSLRKRKQQNRYVIKAKFNGFKLLGFSYRYVPFLIGDIYRILVPDFMIKLKKYLKKLISV